MKLSQNKDLLRILSLIILIIERFLWVYDDIIEWKLESWKESSKGMLAMIIVLDQFSRNMFRWDKRSFIYDHLALSLAEYMIDNNLDKEVDYEYRSFVYMPYMHSESKEIQESIKNISRALKPSELRIWD